MSLHLLLLGDSLVEWGDWTTLLPTLDTTNRGLAGETVAGLAQRLLDEVDPQRPPDHILIMIGTNDLLMDNPYFPATYEIILQRLHLALPTVPIAVNSLFPMTTPMVDDRQIRKVNQELATLAGQTSGCSFLDGYQAFCRHCQPETRCCFLDDGIHLSGQGYKIWAAAIKAHLVP